MPTARPFDIAHLGCLNAYAAQFAADLPQAKTAGWAGVYLQGLLLDGERKNVEGLARRVIVPPGLPAADPKQALHHFISASPWDQERVWRRYRGLVGTAFGSADGYWVVDCVALRKRGRHSVGVQRQPCGPTGRKLNCQVAVGLHYVGPAGHCPLGLRLYLPPTWLDDAARLDQAGVPPDERRPRTKVELALDLLDRVRAEGLPGGAVVAGREFGAATAFRTGIAARGLRYVVEVAPELLVFARDPSSWARVARETDHPRERLAAPKQEPVRVDDLVERLWAVASGPGRGVIRSIVWRRTWPVDREATGEFVAREPVMLFGSTPDQGMPLGFALADLPADHDWAAAARLLGGLDVMRRDYDLMSKALGLTHFEGRSWHGFHRHACMVMMAFGFSALHRH